MVKLAQTLLKPDHDDSYHITPNPYYQINYNKNPKKKKDISSKNLPLKNQPEIFSVSLAEKGNTSPISSTTRTNN